MKKKSGSYLPLGQMDNQPLLYRCPNCKANVQALREENPMQLECHRCQVTFYANSRKGYLLHSLTMLAGILLIAGAVLVFLELLSFKNKDTADTLMIVLGAFGGLALIRGIYGCFTVTRQSQGSGVSGDSFAPTNGSSSYVTGILYFDVSLAQHSPHRSPRRETGIACHIPSTLCVLFQS